MKINANWKRGEFSEESDAEEETKKLVIQMTQHLFSLDVLLDLEKL